MNCKTVNQILRDTSYVRFSGTMEEKRCAEYLASACAEMGLSASIESFELTACKVKRAKLTVDGTEISCTGYWGAADGICNGKLYYLRGTDDIALKKCRDRIVLVDGGVGFSLYDKLIANGALGFITYNGNLFHNDKDIDTREIRFEILGKNRLPAVNIHISDAFNIVKNGYETAEILLEKTACKEVSHNVVLDLEGECEETVVASAHYDSTALSTGAYDNMSGCIGLLYLAEYFSTHPHRRRIRLLWCGSEERGLLGTHAYCAEHKSELRNTVLNINLDILGSVMGDFVAFSCANEKMAELLSKFLARHRFPGSVRYAIRSSDSTAFVHHGVPAVSFARYAPSGTASIHTRYDTPEMVSARQLLDDMKIIAGFAEYIANEADLTSLAGISEKIKADVEKYMERKVL